jgi:hypothetical protein
MDGGYANDDLKIKEFRDLLKIIKENVQDKFTYLSQDTKELEKVTKRLIQFYTVLKPIIYHYKPLSIVPIKELQDMFYSVLQEYPRSSYYQNRLEYYLKHDLLYYPFTNTVDKSNTDSHSSYKIVANKISLTK